MLKFHFHHVEKSRVRRFPLALIVLIPLFYKLLFLQVIKADNFKLLWLFNLRNDNLKILIYESLENIYGTLLDIIV